MRNQDVFLESALVDDRLVDEARLAKARQYALEHECDLVDGLVRSQILSGREIALTRADVCEVPFVSLADFEPCYANTRLLPRALAERYSAYPLFMIDGVLTVAMDNPLNLEAADDIRQIVKCEVDPVLAEREELRAMIARAYSLSQTTPSGDRNAPATQPAAEAAANAVPTEMSPPVVAAVNQLLTDAAAERASDVHINPDDHSLHIRYRIDGTLQIKQGPPLSMHTGLVQRLKVMANLDLTQTRRPQDGKFRFRHGDQNIDVRLSIMPTVCGENVVMRLLPSAHTIHEFHDLGVPMPLADQLKQLLMQPYGMVLASGPTGSGKTTTLYAALNKLNQPTRNIVTIEDPVEIRLPYVRHIQVHSEIGLTFATALRSVLRQDPDVVLVGEIRDGETAAIALQAALTGHMVLATVHTNDAAGVVARLRDFNVPPFVINSAVLAVIAQRLVRRVCSQCVAPATIDPLIRRRFKLEEKARGFVQGKGCGRCGQSGYRGRVGLFEMLTFSSAIKLLVEQGASTEALREAAIKSGMRPMWHDGLEKAQLGQTTLEEVAAAATVISLESQVASKVDAAPAKPAAVAKRAA